MEIAIRDVCVPLAAGQHLFEALGSLGISSVELLINGELFVPSLKTSLREDGAIKTLRQNLAQRKINVCALLLDTDFSGPTGREHTAWTIRAMRAARQLGVPAIRVDAHTPDRSLSSQSVCDSVIRALRWILHETPAVPVDLALENHAYISNDPAFLDKVFDAVPDPRLGLTLDTGNFYWFGHPLNDLYDLCEKYASRVKHTHIKSIHFPAEKVQERRTPGWEYGQYRSPLDEGDIDLKRVVGILRAAGYQRTLCIENESLSKFPEDQRANVIRRDVAALQRSVVD
jgi:sugar phosphate isomerase/epimerase